MLLICLIQKRFFEHINNEMSNHLIRISRQDLLNIRSIICYSPMSRINLTYLPLKLERLGKKVFHNLFIFYRRRRKLISFIKALSGRSELKEVNIEDLSSLNSLELKLSSSPKRITLRNLTALENFKFQQSNISINSDILVKLLEQLPSVKKLTLYGRLSNFHLDNMIHMRELSLKGFLDNDFNYDLFKNICNQLTDISISYSNIDDEKMNKLFDDHHFPNLSKLCIEETKITKLDAKTTFSQFQILKELTLCDNLDLEIIDYEFFSNLKQLTRFTWMDRWMNRSINKLKPIGFDKSHFSKLTNLEYLRLNGKIERIEENMFSNLKNLTHLDLSYCLLEDHQLNAKSFFGLEKLKILDLKSNKLTNFDLRILDNSPQINLVDLSYNKIVNKNEIFNYTKDTNSNVEFKFSFIL